MTMPASMLWCALWTLFAISAHAEEREYRFLTTNTTLNELDVDFLRSPASTTAINGPSFVCKTFPADNRCQIPDTHRPFTFDEVTSERTFTSITSTVSVYVDFNYHQMGNRGKMNNIIPAYHWGTWGRWTPCQVDCTRLDHHHYTQSRTRRCYTSAGVSTSTSRCMITNSGTSSTERKNCDTKHCPKWSSWSNWSDCNLSCGNGSSIRVRHCNQGSCVGDPFQTKSCTLRPCNPVNGNWGSWSSYGACSVTCDQGYKSKTRQCSNPAPLYGGRDCVGDSILRTPCNMEDCTINGGWGSWNSWAKCDVTCGGGHRARTRPCNNPAPRADGKACVGDAIQTGACSMPGCPVDGGWTDFMDRPCSVTCGTGVAVKVRTCTNPAPAFGGKNCTGSALQFATCTQSECVVDGGWSDWSNWTNCGVVCGTGQIFRDRSCSNPTPQHGGMNCNGSTIDSQECHNGICPTDIKSCLGPDIQGLINSTPFNLNSTALPPVCPDTNPRQAEMLIQKYCTVTSSELEWELGIQLLNNCEKVPLYTPLGLINRETKHKQYGILLTCFKETIKVADLSCSETLVVHSYQLNHTETDFHMLIV